MCGWSGLASVYLIVIIIPISWHTEQICYAWNVRNFVELKLVIICFSMFIFVVCIILFSLFFTIILSNGSIDVAFERVWALSYNCIISILLRRIEYFGYKWEFNDLSPIGFVMSIIFIIIPITELQYMLSNHIEHTLIFRSIVFNFWLNFCVASYLIVIALLILRCWFVDVAIFACSINQWLKNGMEKWVCEYSGRWCLCSSKNRSI